jgi:hypothetical protein
MRRPIVHNTDYDDNAHVDATRRRQPSFLFSRRWLGVAGMATCIRAALSAPPELAVPLGLAAAVLVCVACWPRRRPPGEPIPPAQMRSLLARGKAYPHDAHQVLLSDGIYVFRQQSGCYERVEGAMDPLLAQHWVGEQRIARFRDSFERVSWLSYLWRH